MQTKTESPRFRVVTEDYAELFLTKGKTCLIDTDDIPWIRRWKWRAKKSGHCWYAVRSGVVNGKRGTIYLHRWLMSTPQDMDCHHQNFNSLDNREANLKNTTPTGHRIVHSLARITKSQIA